MRPSRATYSRRSSTQIQPTTCSISEPATFRAVRAVGIAKRLDDRRPRPALFDEDEIGSWARGHRHSPVGRRKRCSISLRRGAGNSHRGANSAKPCAAGSAERHDFAAARRTDRSRLSTAILYHQRRRTALTGKARLDRVAKRAWYSVIIPNRDHSALLQAIEAVQAAAAPRDGVIENGGRESRTTTTIVSWNRQDRSASSRGSPVNYAAVNNRGARQQASCCCF